MVSGIEDDGFWPNYWREVTYTFSARGYDVLQIDGDKDAGYGGPFITEVRAFEADRS
ncbi:hypothetical protein [Actinomadura sp. 6N118]|uniref:hypothetical protein n=1 Tax=Actinomadura sp. 6N118 TaxID=3375151 RepID=UPI0037ACF4DB